MKDGDRVRVMIPHRGDEWWHNRIGVIRDMIVPEDGNVLVVDEKTYMMELFYPYQLELV
jgi:hypothetical protein